MTSLIKDGVVMVVADNMAGVYKRAGYVEVVEKSATSPVVNETVNHDESVSNTDDENKDNNTAENTYSKTDINRMNKESLVELSKECGIEVGEESGNSLKKKLIEYFKL